MAVSLLFQEKEVKNQEGLRIYLSNTSPRDLLIQCTIQIKGINEFQESFSLKQNDVYAMGDILKDQVNDRPLVFIEVRALTTEGAGDVHEKKTKIRTQLFMKSKVYSPLLKTDIYQMILFNHIAYKKEKTVGIKDQLSKNDYSANLDEQYV